MPDLVNVQIIYTAQTEFGQFSDALYIPLTEYESMSAEQISALKQARVDAWVDSVRNPPQSEGEA